MKRSENALVDETEVVVATLNDGRLWLVADTFHHDRVRLQKTKITNCLDKQILDTHEWTSAILEKTKL